MALFPRGPKTPEGKARSRNAIRSRRLTDCTVVGNESREAFQDLFKLHVDSFGPLDDVEMGMIEEMASAYWRIRRNWAIENYLLESAAAAQPEGPALPRIAAAWSEVSAGPQFAHLRRDGWLVWASFQIGALKEVTITSKPARAIVN